MSAPGDKISAAISRHNEKRSQTLTLAEKIAQDRAALASVVAGSANGPSPATTTIIGETEES